MKKQTRHLKSALSILLSLLMLATVFVGIMPTALALEAAPPPIDPQSWTLLRDTNWSNYKPNPVIDWRTEHNPASLYNPARHAGGNVNLGIPEHRNTPINGAVILVDFWDRPFLMLGELHKDLFGWHAFNEYDSYQDYLDKIAKNAAVTHNPQRVVNSEEGLLRFWEDYLNKKVTDPALNTYNHGADIDDFWREVSYGKWAVDLKAFGVFHLEGFEFEYGLDYTAMADLPPTFRRGTQRNFMNECLAAANAGGAYMGDFDFFFVCHSGYDESGVWMEFGQVQWAEGKDVPYEYGVRAKMDDVEDILTAHPEYVLSLATRGGYSNNTISTEAAKVRDHIAAGTLDQYVFKFPASDWTWANGYIGGGPTASKPGTAGGPNTAPTRYVAWTSWAAAATRWASSSGYSGTTVRDSKGTNITNIPYSQQAECNGMATYAHEFGHIVNLPDNYSNSYGATYSPDSEPWDLMARGCFAGPFGDHARWSVPGGLEADSAPVHLMMVSKKFSKFYDPGDLKELTVAQLKAGTPLVEEIVARNVPLANKDYPWLADYGLVSPNFYKGIELTFDSANTDKVTRRTSGFTWNRLAAQRMGIEVVQRTGYDSFAPDDGVVLTRIANAASSSSQGAYTVIDSHLYDLEMADYYLNGVAVPYTMGNQAQLFDGAFKAGVSFTDSGYYKGGEYKGDKRVSEEIISGNTVNEFFDSANGLHFYILDKHMNPGKYGEFLSYSVGLLHTSGLAVTGALKVVAEVEEAETWNRVAVVNFKITNEGSVATDIIRASVTGSMDTTLLNNLYAIKPGQTVTVPVYVDLGKGPDAEALAGLAVGLSVSSESNANNKASASVSAQDVLAYTVTFVDWDETPIGTQSVVYNTAAVPPAPVRFGYTLAGWSLDGGLYDIDAPVTDDITLVAVWTRNPITYLRVADIQGNETLAVVTVVRNSTVQLDYVVNSDAIREGIVWSVVNTAYATVDQTGKISIKNLPGTVLLSIRDSLNGASHSIILRII